MKSAESDTHTDRPVSTRSTLSRRAFLAGSGVVGLGVIAGGIGAQVAVQRHAASEADDGGSTPPMRRYVSTDLTIPAVTGTVFGATAAGLICVNPKVDGFRGLMMEDSGEPVWIEPSGVNVTDLRVQEYDGQKVLTYWFGTSTGGHGDGRGVILDRHYRTIAEVRAGNGLHADLHEFNLTDRGTALITAYQAIPYDLTAVDGPADGYLYNCHAQEIDIRSGEVLLDWNVLDHIDVTETYTPIEGNTTGHDGSTRSKAFDAFHINAVDDDGDRLLISMRHTHGVYAIDRSTGELLWRFGGKRSDFSIPEDARFAWQHDIRHHPDGSYSLFDNHLIRHEEGGASRALFFDLDEQAHTATLLAAYGHGDHLGTAMGSAQRLPNGNVLVGWGTDPAMTEFDRDGGIVYEAKDVGAMAYRANRAEWVGEPLGRPDLGLRASGPMTRVHASWNGATEVASWRVLAGEAATDLSAVMTIPRTGFETSAVIRTQPRIAVQALDASGTVLGTSSALRAA